VPGRWAGSGAEVQWWQAITVPWCEPCDRFWNPASVTEAGECPTCGTPVDTPVEIPPNIDSAARQKVPWHFWVAITAAGIYLAWRAIQGIGLLF